MFRYLLIILLMIPALSFADGIGKRSTFNQSSISKMNGISLLYIKKIDNVTVNFTFNETFYLSTVNCYEDTTKWVLTNSSAIGLTTTFSYGTSAITFEKTSIANNNPSIHVPWADPFRLFVNSDGTLVSGVSINYDVYIKDSATLAKIRTTSNLGVRFYIYYDYANYYWHNIYPSALHVGWNTVNVTSFTKQGTGSYTAHDMLSVWHYVFVGSNDYTLALGDIAFDGLRAVLH